MAIPSLRSLAREPLVHFLVLGGALFALDAWRGGAAPAATGTIVVPAGRIESLVAQFTKATGRPPTPQDTDALVAEDVRQEVLYREGLAQGLDRGDVIVRARIAEKMEMLADDPSAGTEPSDDDLRGYLESHRASFDREPGTTLVQVFLDPERHGARLDDDAARLRAKLRSSGAGDDAGGAGDGTMLPRRLTEASSSEVASVFGREFADAVTRLPQGSWEGPIRSDRGAHLVLVLGRTPGRRVELADVRDAVAKAWRADKQREARDAIVRALEAKYRIVVERPRESKR